MLSHVKLKMVHIYLLKDYVVLSSMCSFVSLNSSSPRKLLFSMFVWYQPDPNWSMTGDLIDLYVKGQHLCCNFYDVLQFLPLFYFKHKFRICYFCFRVISTASSVPDEGPPPLPPRTSIFTSEDRYSIQPPGSWSNYVTMTYHSVHSHSNCFLFSIHWQISFII